MADPRTEETRPIPRRTLAGPASPAPADTDGADDSRRFSGRVTAAMASAQQAVKAAAQPPPATRRATSSPAPSPASSPGKSRGRRAHLRVMHIDPLSVMKVSFLLSVAVGIVTVIAVAVVWAVLGAAGVWDSINASVADVSGESFDITEYVGTSRVMGFTMIIAVVDVVLLTAIATLGAFLYNLAAALLGGFEVTLAEDD